jgi:hypothetical protein
MRLDRKVAVYCEFGRTQIATAKLNGVDPQAWLADVLRRIADHPAARLHEFALALEATRNPRRRLIILHHGLGRMVTL